MDRGQRSSTPAYALEGLGMAESEAVVCAICGETAKRVDDQYKCPACKDIFWTGPKKQICRKCHRAFLDFENMADKLRNWIGYSMRMIWKTLCPIHRREMFHGMGTVCEVIRHYSKLGYTPRDFEAELPEELIKLCLSKMNT